MNPEVMAAVKHKQMGLVYGHDVQYIVQIQYIYNDQPHHWNNWQQLAY